jgi:very-short-patch-repair endonuclease
MKLNNSQVSCRALKLRGHAASMREAATASERALWQLLRGGQLGVVFRRQVPLLGFCIADFLAARARLVVEVDGPYHATAARRRADARRDRRLCRAGYRVLRLTAEEVLEQPARALARVVAALAAGSVVMDAPSCSLGALLS